MVWSRSIAALFLASSASPFWWATLMRLRVARSSPWSEHSIILCLLASISSASSVSEAQMLLMRKVASMLPFFAADSRRETAISWSTSMPCPK